MQFLRHLAPERFGIGDRFLVFGFVVLDVGIGHRPRGGPVETAFFQEGFDILRHVTSGSKSESLTCRYELSDCSGSTIQWYGRRCNSLRRAVDSCSRPE